MNERNVAALARLICDPTLNAEPCQRCWDTATDLINRGGVLVPSVLTDEECREAGGWIMDGYECEPTEDGPVEMRSTLERIAKGVK